MRPFRKLIIPIVLFGCFLLFNPKVSSAQNIFYSTEQNFNFRDGAYAVVGQTGGLLYTYTASQEGYFLNAYNDSMALKAKIALDFFPMQTLRAKFINYPSKIIVIYQAIERNRLVVYAVTLNRKALLQGHPKPIDSVRTSWIGNTKTHFSVAVSPDKKYFIVYQKDKKHLKATLINANLQVIHHGKYRLSDDAKDKMGHALLDNKGNFYFSVSPQVGNRKHTEAFHWFQLSPKAHTLLEKTLPEQEDIYYSGLYSKINKNNGLIYTAGFYSDKKNGSIIGIVFFDYDPTAKQFSAIKHILLNDNIRKEATNHHRKKAFNDEHVRELIIRNDGGFLLVSEKAFSHTRTYMEGGYFTDYSYVPMYNTNTTYEYTYGDIALFNFSSNEQMTWHQFIRKNQFTQNDKGLFSSFAFLNTGGSLAFLFNDFNRNSNQIKVAVVDASGKLQMQPMNVGNIGNAFWLPRKGIQVSKYAWIIPIVNHRHIFFARVAF